ncbi:MAG: prephenate dehydratase [Deltaproteobacteria bacterium]|nr:prephenate dehydratase [Deltaproteobacteria bacterium]
MANSRIEELRKKIDVIDDRLLELLNERINAAIKIGQEKKRLSAPVYVPSRETFIVSRLIKNNKGPLKNESIKHIFKEIFSASRASVMPPKIAYLGPEGTFANQAALLEFGNSYPLMPAKNIQDVFNETEYSNCDFGVVPIENSMEGTVSQTLDLFIDANLFIVKEVYVPVSYVLATKEKIKIDKIKRVYSHPQAIAQCRKWIREHLPGVVTVDTESTAQAAKLIQKSDSSAAIVSELTANMYNLKFLSKRLEENPNNVTRFVVIGKIHPERTGNDKTSFIFSLKDKPGTLFAALKPFASYKVNMTKIESRPLKKKAWEYLFFVDIDGHIEDNNIQRLVDELKVHTIFFKCIGSYPKAL